MLRILGAIVRVILAVGTLVGIVYLPADLRDLPDAYPKSIRWIAEVERETLLVWLCVVLVLYLIIVEARPFIRQWRDNRQWLSASDAAQRLFEEYKTLEGVPDLVRESSKKSHPRPVEDVMSSWLEDGVNNEIIQVRGKREHSVITESIPSDVAIGYIELLEILNGEHSDEMIAKHLEEGTKWGQLEFLAGSVERYITDLNADRIHRDNIKTEQQECG